MSRLTNYQYLYRRQRLRVSWQYRRAEPFTTLSANEQVRLWAYFAPTLDLTDKEAIAHRKLVSRRFSALPQQAGRAYVRVLPRLHPELRSGPVVQERRLKKLRTEVVVHGIRRKDVDVKLLARILVSLASEDRLDVRENEEHHENGTRNEEENLKN